MFGVSKKSESSKRNSLVGLKLLKYSWGKKSERIIENIQKSIKKLEKLL